MTTSFLSRRLRRPLLAAAAAGLALPLAVSATAVAAPRDETKQVPQHTSAETPKPRMIITQDGEVDDMNSFIRYLYYANEFDTEGIIYSSSRFHWAGDGESVAPFRWTGLEWVDEYIDHYETIYPNLIQHAEGYPTPDYLRSIYKVGNISNVSEMAEDTEGSDWIKGILLDLEPDDELLYVQAWGGLNTFARALKSIEDEYSGTDEWDDIVAIIDEKVVVYNILNQDATLNGYIKPSWPGVRILDNQSQFWSFAYQWKARVPQPNQYVLKADWMEENLLFGNGPLMEEYRTFRDGKPTPGDDQNNRWRPEQSPANQNVGYDVHDFISEGDSPAFTYLMDFNGLRSAEDPTWGGWGGRFEPNASGWIDTQDDNPFSTATNNRRAYPLTRWIPDIQDDFAGRVAWGVADSFDDANHNPRSSVVQGVDQLKRPGQLVPLTAIATDADGDNLSYRWWQYTEAGTYDGTVALSRSNGRSARFTVPVDANPGETIHVILEVTDDGAPAMKHYQRVVVTVR